jgi:hypothetical protein
MMGDGRECGDVSVAEAEEGDSTDAAPMMPGCHIGYGRRMEMQRWGVKV